MRPGRKPYREGDPLDAQRGPARDRSPASRRSRRPCSNTPGIDGVVLRYGRLYGPGTWFDKPGGPGPLTTDAAAHAALLAVTRGAPGIYNVAEDDGEFSIEKARRRASGFDPESDSGMRCSELRRADPVNSRA